MQLEIERVVHMHDRLVWKNLAEAISDESIRRQLESLVIQAVIQQRFSGVVENQAIEKAAEALITKLDSVVKSFDRSLVTELYEHHSSSEIGSPSEQSEQ